MSALRGLGSRALPGLLAASLLAAACTGGMSSMNSVSGFSGGTALAGGDAVTAGRYGLSGGALMIQPDEPGFLYGTVKWPGEEWRITYFIMLRVDSKGLDGEHTGAYTLDSRGNGSEKGQLRVGTRTLAVDYAMSDDARSETLLLGGKPYNLATGRVFLLDWTKPDAAPIQIAETLSRTTTGPVQITNVKAVAEKVVTEMAPRQPEVRAFLDIEGAADPGKPPAEDE